MMMFFRLHPTRPVTLAIATTFIIANLLCEEVVGFAPAACKSTIERAVATPLHYARPANDESDNNYLLDEFKTASGELINPYKVLRVSRNAENPEIKKAYRDLSRRYHPDMLIYRKDKEIWPGRCNNLDQVRDEWERIKLAYEILSDRKWRKRYDRHETLADPGKALQRTAMNAAWSGIEGVGKGIFGAGAFAFQQLTKPKEKEEQKE